MLYTSRKIGLIRIHSLANEGEDVATEMRINLLPFLIRIIDKMILL
jgi:hypothetical protein